MQRDRYPADWRAISRRIRAREGQRCKWCERANGDIITGTRGQSYPVVLTVAHLDHNPANCSDDNLAALCQACHLAYDAKQHARNAAHTRTRRKIEAGQAELFPASESDPPTWTP